MPKPLPQTTITSAAIEAVREPSWSEGKKIETEMAAVFEPDKSRRGGRYLGDASDRSIGAKLGLPAAMVAKVREEIHGPMLGDPEIEAIRSKIEVLMALGEALGEALGKRLVAAEARIGGGRA